MSESSGVEVSWQQDHKNDSKVNSSTAKPAPGSNRDFPPREASLPNSPPQTRYRASSNTRRYGAYLASAPNPTASQDTLNSTNGSVQSNTDARPLLNKALPASPAATPPSKATSKRPSLLRGSSSEKASPDGRSTSKRSTSWIANISNKFSSPAPTPQAERTQPILTPQPLGTPSVSGNNSYSTSPAVTPGSEAIDDSDITPGSRARDSASGFFSSLTRKLSTSQGNSGAKLANKGAICQRRILNLDPNRERCLLPELSASGLRKVSFCVDVEIAGGPRYRDDDDLELDEEAANKRKNAAKLKERAEGEALKHRQDVLDDTKDTEPPAVNDDIQANGGSHSRFSSTATSNADGDDADGEVRDKSTIDKKKEKKKRSEEERKERKEKRRRRAEENGSIPVEMSMEDDEPVTPDSVTTPSTAMPTPPPPAKTTPEARRDRPTTDPVRIYRRCCQLRETPILKRITEQLMSPSCCLPSEPGTVQLLNLKGSRLQLADMVTLGDWLAVVPVKRLILEDADLNDEGLRCVLAGLLAATKPQPTKRKSPNPRHRESLQPPRYRERSGVVEKLTLNKNPRITRVGWKHIILFLYMCRSIKEIDLSQIPFPDTLPGNVNELSVRSPPNATKPVTPDLDAAELLYKSLSERLGGNRLDEMNFAGCGLSAGQLRKIIDAAIFCGITRLGLAGNKIDDEGLEHVCRYLSSGTCSGLDLGTTNLRGKLGRVAQAFNLQAATPFWSLGLANCNLDSESLKPLFSVLKRLPNLRILDLSHNPKLCGRDNGTISLLRHYLGQMKMLKRLCLSDVDLSAKQAIALADVLPECPVLAHLTIMQNPQLTALANAKDEATQEEACALYASLMAAVRVSNSIVSVDIDVPSAENSEVVKALAKQVVAYSLRNVEHYAAQEEDPDPRSARKADFGAQTAHHRVAEVPVPEILMHLVGHVDGNHENHDNDDPAPDDDYIVGGQGVVKALAYVLGEKASDIRRGSAPSTPTRQHPPSLHGFDAEQRGKAKKMSKNLLDSARKIRMRLRPALVKEAAAGADEMAYRRLIFLDNTLENMIRRFEEEYPETRLQPTKPINTTSAASSLTDNSIPLSINTAATDLTKASASSDEDDLDDEPTNTLHISLSRHNSDVSLASRALAIEEGHLHRLGQRLRRQVIDSPSSPTPSSPNLYPIASTGRPGSPAAPVAAHDPWKSEDTRRLKAFEASIEAISGSELKRLVEHDGWDAALEKLGGNLDDLRYIQQHDPVNWKIFAESQLTARLNNEAQEKKGS